MKSKLIAYCIVVMTALAPLLAEGQNPPMPNWGSDPGSGNSPVGGGASLGGGLVTMLVMAAGYGTRKIYQSRKRLLE